MILKARNLTIRSSSLSQLSKGADRGALVNLQASPFWNLVSAKFRKANLDRSSGSDTLLFIKDRKREPKFCQRCSKSVNDTCYYYVKPWNPPNINLVKGLALHESRVFLSLVDWTHPRKSYQRLFVSRAHDMGLNIYHSPFIISPKLSGFWKKKKTMWLI